MEENGTDETPGIDEQEQEPDETPEGDVEEYSTDETYWVEGYYDDDYPEHENHCYLNGTYNEVDGCWALEDGCIVKDEHYVTHEHGGARGWWNEEEQGWDLEDGCFVKKLWDYPPVDGPYSHKDWGYGIAQIRLPIPVDFTTAYVKPPESIILADSENTIQAMLRDIVSPAREDSRIIIDLEGNNLGSSGTLDLLILHIEHFNKTYLVDVVTLGKSAFEISIDHVQCTWDFWEPCTTKETITLKSVLESEEWPKLLWDCRTDSNALYFLSGVDLKGVEDVQLFENLQYTEDYDSRHPSKNYLLGLAKAIDRYAPIPSSEKNELAALKASFKGQYHIFGIRPLSDEAIRYAANDVKHLGPMLDVLARKLNAQEKFMIKIETARRLEHSHSEYFRGNGYAPTWSRYRGAPDLPVAGGGMVGSGRSMQRRLSYRLGPSPPLSVEVSLSWNLWGANDGDSAAVVESGGSVPWQGVCLGGYAPCSEGAG